MLVATAQCCTKTRLSENSTVFYFLITTNKFETLSTMFTLDVQQENCVDSHVACFDRFVVWIKSCLHDLVKYTITHRTS